MDIWWYLGLFRFRWFCILNYSVFSLVFGATAASVWFPACGGGLLHASHEGVNTCFLSDSAALNHATMNSIHYVVPSALVHGLLTEVSKVAMELESPSPGWLLLRWKYTFTPCTLSKMVSDLCDINVYETSAHRIEGQISGKTARVSTFWLSHRSVVPYTLLVLRFVFETFYGPCQYFCLLRGMLAWSNWSVRHIL